MPFTLPELPFAYDALEPFIDTMTMQIHHDKHHAAYVTNLNKALEGSDFSSTSIDALIKDIAKLPEAIRAPVRNNGGGHLNHSFLWTELGPAGGPKASGGLLSAIDRELGGFDAFKAEMLKAGIGRFGSGWAWLSLDGGKKLVVSSTANQDNPVSEGKTPILGIDVWEHAYYLKYQNRRAEYLEAFFNVIDWKAVGIRFEKAMQA